LQQQFQKQSPVAWLNWLSERAILAPKNDLFDWINNNIITHIPGQDRSYKSIDVVLDPDQAVFYPTEFLNSLQPPGMPPHNLVLKVGAPIMLLRNLEPPKLCNGTRLCVKTLHPHVIEATIMSGCGKLEDVFLPRITIIPSDVPYEFKRLQFPIRLSFAMSINKAIGQSLKVAGVELQAPCFSHGQLYVACSRVGASKNLFILAPDGKTTNVVYPQALN
jgi:ATP-dependent DNA helicase PIF1